MHKHLMIPTLLALSLGLAACATPPNANLEQARSNYGALQSNPQASTLAALETKDAADMLDKADQAFRGDANQQQVDQLAYLTLQRVEVAKQTINLKNAEAALEGTAAERAEARLAARDQQLDNRDAQIQKLQMELQAKQTERGTLVTFGDVLFDLDRAELKPNGLRNVQTLAEFLLQHPERQVIIEGYTDSSGSTAHNQSLSERRANAVRLALVKMGVGPARIVAQGYGKQYPVAENITAADRAMNRRVEVTISNDAKPVAPRNNLSAY
ncbi:MAG TPA: OmpA family protein [Pseudomonas sp.]|nr:OmpA family protein [Pseudomonas sp.]